MDYAAGVWGYCNYNKPNTIQNRAIRSFLGVHKYTSNISIQGDMGWIPPHIRRKLDMIKLLKRILHMPDTRLTHKVLKWDWSHKGKTWSWSIRAILKETKQDLDIDINAPDIDFDSVLKKAEKELMDIEIKKWHNELQSQSKLQFYRHFKDHYGAENYVKECYSKSSRSFIAQIRSGVLPLKIETGRYTGMKREERICDVCKDEVEDEMHFIFRCNRYNNIRTNFIDCANRFYDIANMDNAEKLKVFMTDKRLINRFASYIRECYFSRNDYIYSVS